MESFTRGRVTIHFNSDFSGAVEIVNGSESIHIPGKTLLECVALCYVLPAKIQKLEEARYDDLLLGDGIGD